MATIVASVDGSTDRTDRLEDTVDYAALAGLLLKVSAERSYLTVEGLCGAFATATLSEFPAIKSIQVTIDKLSPVGIDNVESCGAQVVAHRV